MAKLNLNERIGKVSYLGQGEFNQVFVSDKPVTLSNIYTGQVVLKYPTVKKDAFKNRLNDSARAVEMWNDLHSKSGYPAIMQAGYRLVMMHHRQPQDDKIKVNTVYVYISRNQVFCAYSPAKGVSKRVCLAPLGLADDVQNKVLNGTALTVTDENAIFNALALSRECWVGPYFGEVEATDEQIADKLIEMERESGIIILDAYVKGNFLFYQGETFCVDVDAAVGSDNLSNDYFQREVETGNYLKQWNKCRREGKEKTANTLETLCYLRSNFPNMGKEFKTSAMIDSVYALRKMHYPITQDTLTRLFDFIYHTKRVKWNLSGLNTAFHLDNRVSCIQNTLSLNQANPHGQTPLMLTSYAKDTDVSYVRMLIAAGADINCIDNGGNTALMLAILAGNQDIARVLIEAGADLLPRNYDKKNAFDMAIKHTPALISDLCLRMVNSASSQQEEFLKMSYSGIYTNVLRFSASELDVNGLDDVLKRYVLPGELFEEFNILKVIAGLLLEIQFDENIVLIKQEARNKASNGEMQVSGRLRHLSQDLRLIKKSCLNLSGSTEHLVMTLKNGFMAAIKQTDMRMNQLDWTAPFQFFANKWFGQSGHFLTQFNAFERAITNMTVMGVMKPRAVSYQSFFSHEQTTPRVSKRADTYIPRSFI